MKALTLLLFVLNFAQHLLYVASNGVEAEELSPFGFPLTVSLQFPTIGSFSYRLPNPRATGVSNFISAAADLEADNSASVLNLTIENSIEVSYLTLVRMLSPGRFSGETDVALTLMLGNVSSTLEKRIERLGDGSSCTRIVPKNLDIGSIQSNFECDPCEINPQGVDFDNVSVSKLETPRFLNSFESGFLSFVTEELVSNVGNCSGLIQSNSSNFTSVPTSAPTFSGEIGSDVKQEGFVTLTVGLFVLLFFSVTLNIWCFACCVGCYCWKDPPETAAETDRWDRCHSLVKTPTIPLFCRIFFFVLIAATTAFFISANISVGAEINIDFIIGGKFHDMEPIYDFSILASTIEMLKAGVYLLGIILFLFSVVWPYVKLVIMIYLWVAPPSWIRPPNREYVASWVDALGKWSFFDVFALCVTMVIMSIVVVNPGPIFEQGMFGIILSMTAVWGMYANLIAQLMSQGLSIFLLWVHRRAYDKDWIELYPKYPNEGSIDDSEKGSKSLQPNSSHMKQDSKLGPVVAQSRRKYSARSTINGSLQQYEVTTCGRMTVSIALVTVAVLVVSAFFIIGFEVEVVGLLGVIQETTSEGSSLQSFSPLLISQRMIQLLPKDASGLINFGTWCLVITFSICLLVIPTAQALNLLYVWLVPCPVPRLKKLLYANEILASFQYIEVYIIAVIVGCFQLPVLCELLTQGDFCTTIKPFLDELVLEGLTTHSTCFLLVPKVRAGLWIHFFASFLLFVAQSTVRDLGNNTVESHDLILIQRKRVVTAKQSSYFANRISTLCTLGLAAPSTLVEEQHEAQENPQSTGDVTDDKSMQKESNISQVEQTEKSPAAESDMQTSSKVMQAQSTDESQTKGLVQG